MSTCPWEAFKLGLSPTVPVVDAPEGNPCSYLKIETGEDDASAIVRQRGIRARIQNGHWLIVEFDARVSGTNPNAAAVVKFNITGADEFTGEIPNSGDWVHYILAVEVTDLAPNEEQFVDIEFAVFCENKTLDIDNVECRRSAFSCDPDPCSDLDVPLLPCEEATASVLLERIDDLCCLGDINQDGVVGIIDLLLLIAAWTGPVETCCCPEDLNGDGHVDTLDQLILQANWGPCGGPPQQVPIEIQKCLDRNLPDDPKDAARCIAKLTPEPTT